jgi:glycosyltransferase involved in cell wall biosynthesis
MNFEAFKNKYQKTEVEHFPHQVPSNPTVSVLVQAYNHEAFIEQCLESILEQKTDFDYEILLGEDYSTDRTREICREYATKYPEKIRLFLHHPDNKINVLSTTTGNFNAFYNLFSARGKYIAFCEGDDYWNDSFKLQKQVKALRFNDDLALTYHSYQEVYPEEDPLPKEIVLEQPRWNLSKIDLKKLIYHPLFSTMCFCNINKDIPEQMTEVINVDSSLISHLGNYGSAKFIDNINPSFYRRHKGGIWSGERKELKFKSKLLTYKKLIDYYSGNKQVNMAKFFRSQYNLIVRQILFYYLKKGKIWSFLKLIARCYKF